MIKNELQQILDKPISIEDVAKALRIQNKSAYNFLHHNPELVTYLVVQNKNEMTTTSRMLFQHILKIGTSRYSKYRIEDATKYLLNQNVKLEELKELVDYRESLCLKYEGRESYILDNKNNNIIEKRNEKWYNVNELTYLFSILNLDDVKAILDIAKMKDCIFDDNIRADIVGEYVDGIIKEKLASYPELESAISKLREIRKMEEVLKGFINGNSICRPEIDLIKYLYEVNDSLSDLNEHWRQKFVDGLLTIKSFSQTETYKARCSTILRFFLGKRKPQIDFSILSEKEFNDKAKNLYEKLKGYDQTVILPTSQKEFEVVYDKLKRYELLHDLSEITKEKDYDHFVIKHFYKSS
jgi:hypothetical protein